MDFASQSKSGADALEDPACYVALSSPEVIKSNTLLESTDTIALFLCGRTLRQADARDCAIHLIEARGSCNGKAAGFPLTLLTALDGEAEEKGNFKHSELNRRSRFDGTRTRESRELSVQAGAVTTAAAGDAAIRPRHAKTWDSAAAILSDLIMLAIALLASEHGQFHLLPGMPVVLALES